MPPDDPARAVSSAGRIRQLRFPMNSQTAQSGIFLAHDAGKGDCQCSHDDTLAGGAVRAFVVAIKLN